jgi:hypothetical protein
MPDMQTHPDYATEAPRWRLLAHCADGDGPFRDGGALIPHPREWQDHAADRPSQPTKKLLERRSLAVYDHLAGLVLETKLAALFRQAPVRRATSDNHAYLTWAAGHVDEAGHSLTAWLRRAYRSALVFGHGFALMDRTRDDGPTAADKAPLVLRAYSPLDVVDWLLDAAGQLTGLYLVETLARTSFDQPASESVQKVYAVGPTTTQITVRGAAIEVTEAYPVVHGFGVVPVVPLYAHRSAHPLFGRSALHDPGLFVDLYNLTSERRELLRKQTFSILNVPLGTGADGGPATSLSAAQAMLGQTSGSNSVLFSTQPAQYLSADTANIEAYSDVIGQLTRHIFRLTATPYDVDSRDAESAESRRLKRQDFSTVLAGYARELETAELAIAQLWFRGTYGERWAEEWARAGITVTYPQAFEVEDFTDLVQQAQAAQALPLGESRTFRGAHAAQLLERFLPDADAATKAQIRAEIDQQPTAEESRAGRLSALADRFRVTVDDDTPTRGLLAAEE